MLKKLFQTRVVTQLRMMTVLALLSVMLAAGAGLYVFFAYEDFRQHVSEVEAPLLGQISSINLELTSIQYDLLVLIAKAKQGTANEEAIYRQGRKLLDRIDAIRAAIPVGLLDHTHGSYAREGLQNQLTHYRNNLLSAVEMVSVNLGLAEHYVQQAALDTLTVNRNVALQQQQFNQHLLAEVKYFNQSLWKMALSLGVLLLFFTGLSYLLLQRLSSNIAWTFISIQNTLLRLAAGETAIPVLPAAPTPEAVETATALESFRQTLLELAALRAGLESEVADRTQSLKQANLALAEQIDHLHLTQKALRLFRQIFESTAEAIMVTALDGSIVDINDAFTLVTGYSRNEIIGQNPRVMSSGRHDREFYQAMWLALRTHGHWVGEVWDRRRSGEIYPKLLSINTVYDGDRQAINYVGVFSDISTIKETERQLEKLAYFDRLTGLPNRQLLFDRIGHANLLARRSGILGAVLFLDLDRFKHINDTFGHQAGDELLAEVASRLACCVRASDTVGRLAGDEFLILLEELSAEVVPATLQAQAVGDKIIAALSAPFVLSQCTVYTSASIGIALFGMDEVDHESLLIHADVAMYAAKNNGRGSLHFFDPEMEERIRSRNDLEQRLRIAVREKSFELLLQPQCDGGKNIVGVEALIRWRDDQGRLISPEQFILLAEEIHLIHDIGSWVMDAACRVLKRWALDPLLACVPIAINISGKQFNHKNFVPETQSLLALHEIDPALLKMELTESVVLEDLQGSIEKMHELQRSGIRFAMDDFGTGYSSLAYLRRLPFNQIKIDRSFIGSMLQDDNDLIIVRTILEIGRLKGIEVIAEGVEIPAQYEKLLNLGCTHFQGYLFSKPLTITECEGTIRTSALVESRQVLTT